MPHLLNGWHQHTVEPLQLRRNPGLRLGKPATGAPTGDAALGSGCQRFLQSHRYWNATAVVCQACVWLACTPASCMRLTPHHCRHYPGGIACRESHRLLDTIHILYCFSSIVSRINIFSCLCKPLWRRHQRENQNFCHAFRRVDPSNRCTIEPIRYAFSPQRAGCT